MIEKKKENSYLMLGGERPRGSEVAPSCCTEGPHTSLQFNILYQIVMSLVVLLYMEVILGGMIICHLGTGLTALL